MDAEDRLERLQDIEWAFNAIEKWAVNPSRYRKPHQNSILSALSATRVQIKALIEDAKRQAEGSSSSAPQEEG